MDDGRDGPGDLEVGEGAAEPAELEPPFDPLGESFHESLGPADRAAIARFVPKTTFLSHLVVHFLARGSQLIMFGGNSVTLRGVERFHEALGTGRGLLTFSNHVSLFDDPMVNACLLPRVSLDIMRWIGADALNFFGDGIRGRIFSAGQCVPVVRGAGMAQPGMRFLADRLEAGDWVHLFPEGGRTRDPDGLLRTPLKNGMALMIRETRPVVLPFYHRGMHRVLPIGSFVPRVGKKISVTVGETHDADLGLADKPVEEITEWVLERLLALQEDALAHEAAGEG